MSLAADTPRVRNWRRVKSILRSRAYKDLFLGDKGALTPAGERALADLRTFCFAQRTTSSADAILTARREGRREVWLRITKHLNLDEQQVQKFMEVEDE